MSRVWLVNTSTDLQVGEYMTFTHRCKPDRLK
jgi:hypothetical protein